MFISIEFHSAEGEIFFNTVINQGFKIIKVCIWIEIWGCRYRLHEIDMVREQLEQIYL
jgi:hypothetical protein